MKLEKKTSERLSCNVHKRRQSVYLSRSVKWITLRLYHVEMTEYLNTIAVKRIEQQQWFLLAIAGVFA